MAARFPRFHVGVTPFKGRKCAEKVFQSAYRRGCDLRFRQRRGPDSAVSIHAPAWGATGWEMKIFMPSSCFNPRTRVGCDIGDQHVVRRVVVSIHAPAWGATTTAADRLTSGTTFQSTHPRGVRHHGLLALHRRLLCFNPRTRVGCDSFTLRTLNCSSSFNPRTRVGCDWTMLGQAPLV